MAHEECDPLCVHVGSGYVISCWKLTKEELEEFNRTGKIWLWIVGNTMPPAALSGLSPFKKL